MVVPLRKAEENKQNCNYNTGLIIVNTVDLDECLSAGLDSLCCLCLQCKDKYIFLA